MVQPDARVEEVMTKSPTTLDERSTVVDAARAMRDHDFGGIIVTSGDRQVRGFLSDRDIVIRCVAEGRDPSRTMIGDICSRQVTSLSPNSTVDEAVRLMAQRSVRRLPVMSGDVAVGIVSLGDLARERDPRTVLGAISTAPPNH